jgi:hypothetical protein
MLVIQYQSKVFTIQRLDLQINNTILLIIKDVVEWVK